VMANDLNDREIPKSQKSDATGQMRRTIKSH
jgi:hypothetical protein